MADYLDLIETARKRTGLQDFGCDSFIEGLEILTKAFAEESGMNDFGQRAMPERIIGHLVQRLQVEDWYHRYPDIDDVEITAPLFGVGLPRTGSSVLSSLLSCDKNVRYLRRWESSQPTPPPATVQGPDPRRLGVANAADEEMSKRSHTPTGIDAPIECQDLMSLDFKSQIFIAFAKIPTYADWLLNAELESTYAYEKRVLKLLCWQEPTRPWRLKAPTHILYMDALIKAFPDARFVMTHRDPTDVLVSVCDVFADIYSNFTDKVDNGYIGELSLETWSIGMDRLMDFRKNGQEHRFHDVHFTQTHKDPAATVRGLYEWLDEDFTAEFEHAVNEFWAHNNANREWQGKKDASVYNLDLEGVVRPRFNDYVRKMESWTGVHTAG